MWVKMRQKYKGKWIIKQSITVGSSFVKTREMEEALLSVNFPALRSVLLHLAETQLEHPDLLQLPEYLSAEH